MKLFQPIILLNRHTILVLGSSVDFCPKSTATKTYVPFLFPSAYWLLTIPGVTETMLTSGSSKCSPTHKQFIALLAEAYAIHARAGRSETPEEVIIMLPLEDLRNGSETCIYGTFSGSNYSKIL